MGAHDGRYKLFFNYRRMMEDLVRVCVADAAEKTRIGQHPLHGVVLAPEQFGESRQIDLEDLGTTGVERRQRIASLDEMERSTPL